MNVRVGRLDDHEKEECDEDTEHLVREPPQARERTWKQFIETVDKRMLIIMTDLIVFGKKHQETENGGAW
eukprot:PDM60229.1 hypothetical protein PRIPAC_54054 [Pristionchus pacificus]